MTSRISYSKRGNGSDRLSHQLDIDVDINHPWLVAGIVLTLVAMGTAFALTGSALVSAIAAGVTASLTAATAAAATWRRRLHAQEDENTRIEERLDDIRRSSQLAIEMHDTLSNELTFISTTARRRLQELDAGPGEQGEAQGETQSETSEAETWRNILDSSQRAFQEVHGIIDFLAEHNLNDDLNDDRIGNGNRADDGRNKEVLAQNNSPQTATTDRATAGTTPSFMSQLDGELAAMHRFLEPLGYDGTIAVNGMAVVVDAASRREALSLLHEISTNIARHVAPGPDAYVLYVMLSPEYIEIREVNDIPDAAHTPQLGAAERSGRGLGMHREVIASLGGECRTRGDDGAWMLYARIPCRPQP
ncbi:histidine kinase [Bifidobacterium callitrichos]|uniref:Histidine kinase n=1 Tax=Bifidobacterium callitrichos TaxID=762209 RepID=A0A5M9ZD55_9BIFI|nr:histidine kinase [Bifidobacterium callitrichos]KAA8816555.1 histidine kinase [Bifidobacterium callitrichos]